MAKLSKYMKQIVKEQKLGFVATVNAKGKPCVSPKGTFFVLDDEHLIFGDLRSPQTTQNLKNNPWLEVNFVDQFSRKGFRAKGKAEIFKRNSPEFNKLISFFKEWPDLIDMTSNIIKIKIESASNVASPDYEIGVTETKLRAEYSEYFKSIQP